MGSAKKDLRLDAGILSEPGRRAAQARLMRDVLGLEVCATDPGFADSTAVAWTSFSLFEPEGRCVANVGAAILPLCLDGYWTKAAGIRDVAVDPDWRGQGLFRDLMHEALAWCDGHAATPALLYTGDPELYGRFGFRPLAQHAFANEAPAPLVAAAARRLDLDHAPDRALLDALMRRREPLSSQCALGADVAMLTANVAKDDALEIAYLAAEEALIIFEADDDSLVIADIIAAIIPDMATILGALGRRHAALKTLFPPDKLSWRGEPLGEDTGLMIRGPIPPAMARPFMFPPTVEF